MRYSPVYIVLFSAVMAEGAKVFLKLAFFHLSVLYLQLDEMSVKNLWRGWSGMFIIVRARRMMAS